jgi:uncharacterized protein (TIGR03085 family)
MTRLAQAERTALCDTALAVGADEPTLCGEWDVKDLVCHLLLRESSPAALGIVVRPLARLTDAEMRRLGKRDLAVLVERLRGGPPRWSPYAVPKVDTLVNTLEYFVHHEDIRRAQPSWTSRTLSGDDEKQIWSLVRTAGKGLVRSAPVGVTIENATTGSRAGLKDSTADADTVTVRGLPSEITLFVFGRRDQSDVELLGDPGAVARLKGASLGL